MGMLLCPAPVPLAMSHQPQGGGGGPPPPRSPGGIGITCALSPPPANFSPTICQQLPLLFNMDLCILNNTFHAQLQSAAARWPHLSHVLSQVAHREPGLVPALGKEDAHVQTEDEDSEEDLYEEEDEEEDGNVEDDVNTDDVQRIIGMVMAPSGGT